MIYTNYQDEFGSRMRYRECIMCERPARSSHLFLRPLFGTGVEVDCFGLLEAEEDGVAVAPPELFEGPALRVELLPVGCDLLGVRPTAADAGGCESHISR